ncbi:MAG: hypothetical protein LBM75_00660 [Myxococcales bacterium]|jgi:hypothetical protein|nr:hypothetical protein [Myxococcales bacterium]
MSMNDSELPVTIAVRRPDGSIDNVRVGTAVRDGNGFRLRLDELRIGATGSAAPIAQASQASSMGNPAPAWGLSLSAASVAGAMFPNYGRSKGRPVVGATMNDLEFYANGCRRTLNDPTKARWHDKERVLLAAIEAEMAKHAGGGAAGASFSRVSSAASPLDDIPPPDMNFGPPPDEDDDIPF